VGAAGAYGPCAPSCRHEVSPPPDSARYQL